jgi:hypothetical protein
MTRSDQRQDGERPNPAMNKPMPAASRDTIWDHKPWWCQPWSILLTGSLAVAVSWIWLQLWWLTALVSAGVLLWWGLFLVLVPRAWLAAQVAGET